MKKAFVLGLSLFFVAGCSLLPTKSANNGIKIITDENVESQQTVPNDVAPAETSKFQEGKYVDVSPDTSEGPSQGEGYSMTLELRGGVAIRYNPYFDITDEGTYSYDGNTLTINFTRQYGMTTYGEQFDESVNDTLSCHVEGNRIIVDSMSGFDAYEPGSMIYELM